VISDKAQLTKSSGISDSAKSGGPKIRNVKQDFVPPANKGTRSRSVWPSFDIYILAGPRDCIERFASVNHCMGSGLVLNVEDELTFDIAVNRLEG
jgi:hypothetical protein